MPNQKWKKCPKCDEGHMHDMIHFKAGERMKAIWSCNQCDHSQPRDEIWSKTKRNKIAAKLRRMAKEAEKKGNPDWLFQIQEEVQLLT